jgi:hypothetical protein
MSDAAFSFVVDFDVAGKHVGYVYSDKEIELTEGTLTRYFGYGLLSLELPSVGRGSASSVSMVLADGLLWQEALLGRPVHDATVRVLAVPRGARRVSDCVTVYIGVVNDLEYNADDGTLALGVAGMELREERPFPPAQVGDYLRFPNNLFEGSSGQAVPVLYGTCFEVPLVLIDDPLTEGPWRYVIAGHRILDTSYDAGMVIDNDGIGVGGPYTVQTAIDGLGGLFSYIELEPSSDPAGPGPVVVGDIVFGEDPPEQLYIQMVRGKPRNGAMITGLADVLEDMWLNYGPTNTPLDYPRTTQARQYLNAFSVGVRFDQVEQDATLAEILESRFGSQFPVSLSLWGGAFGWDYIGRKQDRPPVGHIRYGQNTFLREKVATTPRSEVVNNIEVDYQRSGRSASTQKGYRLDETNDLLCRASVSRWGKARLLRMEVPDATQIFAGDNNAAYLAASEVISRRYDVFTRVSYMVNNVDALRWNLGEPVLVTDADMGWENARFYIEAKRPDLNGLVYLDLESAEPFYAQK